MAELSPAYAPKEAKEPLPFATPLLLFAALLGRIPFLGGGYGTDPDGWRVGLAGRYMMATGRYGSSRPPGHPVQDVAVRWLVGLGSTGVNGGTALLSLVAVYFFYRLTRRLALPSPLILSLAFAFTPLVYLHSVDALDYVWALALLLVATELTWSGRFVLAGISLGLATGCRITSLAMLVPLAFMCPPNQRLRALVRIGLSSVCVATLCYVPVVMTYGVQYLRFTQTQYPLAVYIVKELTVDVFGLLGLLGIGLAVVGELLQGRRTPRPPAPESWHRLGLGFGVLLVCYLAIYIRLPDDAGYLLPIVPFALLWLATILSPRRLLVCSAMLIASSFVLKVRQVNHQGAPDVAAMSIRLPHGLALELRGVMFEDHARRVSDEAYADAVLRATRRLPAGSALFASDWYPILAYRGGQLPIYQFPRPGQVEALGVGHTFYLAGADRDIAYRTGIDLRALGGSVLEVPDSLTTRK